MVFVLQEAEASVLLFVVGLVVQYDVTEALCEQTGERKENKIEIK